MSIPKISPEITKAHCPLIKPSKLIGDAWVLLIIKELISGPKRFSQISQSIPEITNRVLAQRLKFLCENGIIERTEFARSSRVDYHLTPMGTALKPVILSIEKFGNTFLC
jgi:DNA-binding HxlR family transcriptional regulator